MEKSVSIGAGQLFGIMYICRMLTTVTYSPLLSDDRTNGSFFLNIIFACIFIFMLCVCVYVFYKAFPEKTPVETAHEKMKKPLTVLYSSIFLFSASVSLSRFFIFLTSAIFPEKDMTVFLVIAVLMCAYCAYLGLEAISRANVIFLFITVFGVAAILFTVSDKISIYNLDPFFYYPVSNSVKSGLFAAGRTVEATAFLFLANKTNGRIKKGFFIFFALFFLCLLTLFFFLGGVSGSFSETQIFPFYSLAVISRFPFFERLDAVATAIWIFAVLIKCSLFMYIVKEQTNSFLFKSKRISLQVSFVTVTALSLWFSKNLTIHKTVSSPYIFIALTVFGAVIIPLFQVLRYKRRKPV